MARRHNHLHARLPHKELAKKAPETIYKTVYETMSADFDGPIAGWTTIGVDAETTKTTESIKTKTADATVTSDPSPTHSAGAKGNSGDDTSDLPQSLTSNSVNLSGHSTLALASSTSIATSLTASTSTNTLAATNAAVTSSPSVSSAASATSSGSSAGTIAGVVIGVLGGILVVALLVFLLFNRRKKDLEKQRQEQQEEEKSSGVPYDGGVTRTASVYTARTSATAPRLSLRPVTEFNPTFNERRSSKGAGLMLASTGASQQAAKEGSLWERPSTGHNAKPENPFADAARSPTPTGDVPTASRDQPRNPFDSPEHVVGMAHTTDMPAMPISPVSPISPAGVVTVAGASLTRKASTKKADSPPPLDLTMPAGPPSPTGTEFSMNSVAPGQSPGPSKSAAAIADAGGPPSTAVHRVQLDFHPSMEDEMELRAGHLVRILHEYDDGWTLCIRLDRSQQGVVPRTCLSTRPVKPRPAGGPPGSRNGGPPVNPQRGPRGPGPNHTGQRPMTPQGGPPRGPPHGRPESPLRPMAGRPQSPAQMRSYSSANAHPAGRPASPGGNRPMSPAGQPRSQSPSGPGPRHAPAGPSPMNPNNDMSYRGPPSVNGQVGRKPVPGQAY
ncbi:hypothetical protein F5Y18DRAFT_64689 [Xylariaceae sp. FL1019]|nr:hypothetical protein F5Y18DRAFT_64689 [Xylariaceae sp. FL1019]